VSKLSSVREGFRAVRSSLTELLKEAPVAAPRVADALEALDHLERAVDVSESVTVEASTGRQRGLQKSYWVERRGTEEVLTEHRLGDPSPFRCPRSTYNALARAISRTKRLTKYEDLARTVRKELGSSPADYQLRLTLRFWISGGVRLVERSRARYRPINARDFLQAARTAWERTRRVRVGRLGTE